METEATIRRQGNSVGLVLPQSILRMLGLTVGQTVSLQTTTEGLLIKPMRRRYTAAELNAQCDQNAPISADMEAWDTMPSAGSEI